MEEVSGSPWDESLVERGRSLAASGSWGEAHATLLRARALEPLTGDDLELLARAAYMLGRDDDYVAALELAHDAHLAMGAADRASRCGCFIGLNLMPRGEHSLGAGWFARAERLLDRERLDCAERGYLMIPTLLGRVGSGDHEGASAVAAKIVAIAERFDDRDLLALGSMEQAHALFRLGHEDEGGRLLDELLVAVSTRELSPVVTGITYCNTILFCAAVYDLPRAREWTAALSRWCDQQPEMLAHTGVCMVHRAELFELAGEWQDALEEAGRAERRSGRGVLNQGAAGHACYRRAEVLRRQGEFDEAEEAYEKAAALGCSPQPGLALLRLAQGRPEAAIAAVRRVLGESEDEMQRARVLPAAVESMISLGDADAARRASEELDAIASSRPSPMLGAIAAHARGAVALAGGDPSGALASLRASWQTWQALDVPYESARIRVLVALACRALGDEDTALLELRIAGAAFDELGALPDARRVRGLLGVGSPSEHGLTDRELDVLRLLARGLTNKAIGAELSISERTVDRHVSNIFAKTGTASRAAATAFAYERRMV
jgi:DNA-binding CsgD family transcriptional regulator